jgi:hypothetical protein
MKKLPNIVNFILRFALIYIAIILLHKISIVKQINIGIYTAMQQAVFNIFHPSVKTDFDIYKPKTNEVAPYDFSINIYSEGAWKGRMQGVKPTAIVNQGARLLSIIPFAFLLGLVLASPSSWQRKLIGISIAGILVLIYLSLKYTHLINSNAVALSPDSFSIWMSFSKLLTPCYRTHEAMFLLIVPIWMFSTLTKKDVKWLIG